MNSKTIHLINSMENLGGAELRTIEMCKILSKVAEVNIWATRDIDLQLRDKANIRRINEHRHEYPTSGIFVFIGCYQPIGEWLKKTAPSRIILLHNTPTPHIFKSAFEKLSLILESVEIVYASDWLKRATGLPGEVQASPIDLEKFSFKLNYSPRGNFRVGRLSRDHIQKHDPDDCELYLQLANNHCDIDIMGGKVLQPWLTEHSNIFLSNAGNRDSAIFLRGLDCFYYKTNPTWKEPFGRVILEAMCTGLPVVAHVEGGYAEHIENGVDGFLFEDRFEAFSTVIQLRDNIELRKRIGTSARKKALNLYSEKFADTLITYYTKKSY